MNGAEKKRMANFFESVRDKFPMKRGGLDECCFYVDMTRPFSLSFDELERCDEVKLNELVGLLEETDSNYYGSDESKLNVAILIFGLMRLTALDLKDKTWPERVGLGMVLVEKIFGDGEGCQNLVECVLGSVISFKDIDGGENEKKG
jgi:hypothetical protein